MRLPDLPMIARWLSVSRNGLEQLSVIPVSHALKGDEGRKCPGEQDLCAPVVGVRADQSSTERSMDASPAASNTGVPNSWLVASSW